MAEAAPSGHGQLGRMLRFTPPWLISMVVHAIVLIVLAMLTVESSPAYLAQVLTVDASGEDEQLELLEELEFDAAEVIDLSVLETTDAAEIDVQETDASLFDDEEAAEVSVELSDFGLEQAPRADLMATIGSYTGTGLAGRGKAGRAVAVRRYGGTRASERAVALGLKWLAEHQYPDGSWRFDFTRCPQCGGRCANPGTIKAVTGATGLALLPFLGAGQTHQKGDYRHVVQGGLKALLGQMKVTPRGADLRSGKGSDVHQGGNMYCHGIAATALCEAYALTHDPDLHDPAQAAINWIVNHQNTTSGGWGYQGGPDDKPTMSITGWQFMALKSGHLAYLDIPPQTFRGVGHWLDLMAMEGGSQYGYRESRRIPTEANRRNYATTAIGLLGRIYLGAKHDDPVLQRGIQTLLHWGPSRTFLYYDYYATQVVFQYGGEPWKTWNPAMRDMLVATQVQQGHQTGSWWDPYSQQHTWSKWAGRLYTTAMAIMTLEVYYRHMAVYDKRALPSGGGADEEFAED